MASPIRKKDTSVIDRLLSAPHRFSFYQAIRLLTASHGASNLGAPGGQIGTIANATDESIRFQSKPALEFPTSEIVSIENHNQVGGEHGENGDATMQETQRPDPINPVPIKIEVAFWGLIGSVGALPNHYTQLVIDRVKNHDHAMHDFLGMFSHRQLSFFYRSWEKYFVAAGFERGQREDPSQDLFREALLALTDRGTVRLRDQLQILDDVGIYYGGLFIDRPNAESLGQMITDFLGLPTTVLSLFGSWLQLPKSEQSRMGMVSGHCRLGVDTVLGERVWDPTSKFRVQIGPVNYAEFQLLMPTGSQLIPICQLIRSYVGCEFLFDVQVVLRADEIPACRLGAMESDDSNANLGWNTWLCSQTPSQDSNDAVFLHDGAPTGTAVPVGSI
jgi:type VI secretion system protein ImpH